ncbi:PEP-CTERM sorting domain-containing protein [Nostocaceae cyanobacterium CENA369]|uniref:PEP-CTERM sorting domain-containing protein n=1 Tax=Dendronalium phyllosphericum CENA369 TaxID=1725256 RepID=A0A8J7I7Z9_9NOST|nr:PEP-CTERM sorting domain-containing protein [Dendronalium phyllosphericum]MBH8577214.1 PEP-CTERM sorting domain-containing protein [Dendronalium phyllosphericum CENA369]
MSVQKTIFCLASVTILFAVVSKSASAATIKQTFSDFNGTFNSVNLPIGGREIPTGVISASQNPNLLSVATFNTDTKQTIFNLNFLLDFPLLKTLGLQSVPIAPFETGSYRVDGQDLIADVTGQGIVSGSSPFAGIQTFFEVRWRVTSPLNTSTFLGQIESEVVTICPSSSQCVQTTGTGKATISLASVPEPTAIAGIIAVGAIGCLMKSRWKPSW